MAPGLFGLIMIIDSATSGRAPSRRLWQPRLRALTPSCSTTPPTRTVTPAQLNRFPVRVQSTTPNRRLKLPASLAGARGAPYLRHTQRIRHEEQFRLVGRQRQIGLDAHTAQCLDAHG